MKLVILMFALVLLNIEANAYVITSLSEKNGFQITQYTLRKKL
jgi:hypothetical protein